MPWLHFPASQVLADSCRACKEGWALKEAKKTERLNEAQKSFLGYIHTVPDEFSTGSKIDRLLCSHGTVQYFCSVQTELTYWMKF